MRVSAIVFILSAFLLSVACSPPATGSGNGSTKDPQGGDSPAGADKAFPRGWSGWAKITDKIVVRKERERAFTLHHNSKGGGGTYPAGTTLVKAEYTLAGDTKGDLVQLSVMHKVAEGWQYEAFTPSGKRLELEAEACQLCHIQRKSHDFVFSEF